MSDNRNILSNYILEFLNSCGGSSEIIPIAKAIWEKHEQELRDSGDLFYTWQYEMRWAVQRLRDQGIVKYGKESLPGVWELA